MAIIAVGEDADKPMETIWVTTKYTGEEAKKAMDQPHAYIVVENGKEGQSRSCVVAFRIAKDRPIPDHVIEVTNHNSIARFERIRRDRQAA